MRRPIHEPAVTTVRAAWLVVCLAALLQGCSLVMQALDKPETGQATAPSSAAAAPAPAAPAPPEPTAAPTEAPRLAQALAPMPAPPPAAPPQPAASPSLAATARASQGVPSAGGPYALQVGAYRVEASAQAVRADIAARLASTGRFSATERVVRVVERNGLFRVLIGALDSLSAAAALRARLRGLIGQDAFATRP
jgi:cell division protein FtsN